MAGESELRHALEEIAEKEGMKKGQFNISFTKEHENPYTGCEKLVVVTEHRTTNSLYLKIKQPPTNDNPLKIPWHNCIFNNVHYYSKVLPVLQTYGRVPMSPKYYASSLKRGEEYLILENLESSIGYKKLAPSTGMNLHHAKEAVKILSYFHCTIDLWKNESPDQFKRLCRSFKPFLGSNHPSSDVFLHVERLLQQIMPGIWAVAREQKIEIRANLQKLMPTVGKILQSSLQVGNDVEDQQWTTLVNCLTYSQNFLFKYNLDGKTVMDVGLEDWSATRLGSPVLDLSLLLFSSIATEAYADIRTVLGEYSIKTLTPREIMEIHFPRFGPYGVLGAVLITAVKTIEDKVDCKIEQVNDKLLMDQNFTSTVIPDFRQRLVAIIKAAVANKVF